MRLSNLAGFTIAALTLAGCGSKPELVRIDFDSLSAEMKPSVLIVQEKLDGMSPVSAELESLKETSLYGSIDKEEQASIIESLKRTREKAYERALESLRKQYMSGVDASVADATQAVKLASEEDWNETSDSLRKIFEEYAPREGALRLTIYAIKNSTPKTRAGGIENELRNQLNEVSKRTLATREEELQKWKALFEAEIQPILESFAARQSERDQAPVELGRELAAKFEEEAKRNAQQIVRSTFESDEPFNVILKEKLEPVPSLSSRSNGVKESNLVLKSDSEMPVSSLKNEAKVFAETRGYALSSLGRDVTREFIEWRRSHQP